MSEERAVANASGVPNAITVELQYPITFGSRTIDTIKINPMNGSHQRRLIRRPDKDPLGMMCELASLLSGEPEQVIDALVGRDLAAVNSAVEIFFTATQGTGNDE